jgi:hypothetical protein
MGRGATQGNESGSDQQLLLLDAPSSFCHFKRTVPEFLATGNLREQATCRWQVNRGMNAFLAPSQPNRRVGKQQTRRNRIVHQARSRRIAFSPTAQGNNQLSNFEHSTDALFAYRQAD